MSKKTENRDTKEYALDIVKDVLIWLVVTALSFVYWMVVLLLISLFLLNVWHITFEEILRIAFVLMIITSIGYIGVLIYRRRH